MDHVVEEGVEARGTRWVCRRHYVGAHGGETGARWWCRDSFRQGGNWSDHGRHGRNCARGGNRLGHTKKPVEHKQVDTSGWTKKVVLCGTTGYLQKVATSWEFRFNGVA